MIARGPGRRVLPRVGGRVQPGGGRGAAGGGVGAGGVGRGAGRGGGDAVGDGDGSDGAAGSGDVRGGRAVGGQRGEGGAGGGQQVGVAVEDVVRGHLVQVVGDDAEVFDRGAGGGALADGAAERDAERGALRQRAEREVVAREEVAEQLVRPD